LIKNGIEEFINEHFLILVIEEKQTEEECITRN